jgi:hypothetical protein
MIAKFYVFTVAVFLAIAATARAGDLRIVYDSSSLTKIEVSELKPSSRWQMRFTWHTPCAPVDEKDNFGEHQSLESFDKHSAEIKLTTAELARLENWVKQNEIFDWKSEYPESSVQTYGSAFPSSLTVEMDGKKYTLKWTGDTKVPKNLGDAIDKLVQICQEIRKSREKS